MTKEEEGKQIIMDIKFAEIIDAFSKRYNVPLEEATNLFYKSDTMELIEKGVADLHCRSDIYLADELELELREKGIKYN